MTRINRYIRDAKECGAIVVIKEIDEDVKKLEKELRFTKNGFRRTCIQQEIDRYNQDRRTIEKMFID